MKKNAETLRIILCHLCTVLILFAFNISATNGQSRLTSDSISVPQPPNAAELGKYGDVPVSLHTGIPKIDIPIWTVREGSLKLPISLSYHSSGIKVSQIASSAGLGWSLNAGGVITREIKGLPDEGGQMPKYQDVEGYYETNGLQDLDSANLFDDIGHTLWTGIGSGLIDGESDIYSFNFNGYSGSFYFDKDRNVRFKVHSDLKVEVNYDHSINSYTDLHSQFVYFKITTPDGAMYYFGGDEQGADINSIDRVYSASLNANELKIPQVTSWYLVKILDANEVNEINFTYESQSFENRALGTWRSSVDAFNVFHGSSSFGYGPFDAGDGNNAIKVQTQEARLISIQSDASMILFNHLNAREDLGTGQGVTMIMPPNVDRVAKSLDMIEVRGRDGDCIRQFVLDQDYFDCKSISYANVTSIPAANGGANPDLKKLRLLGLSEETCNGSEDPKTYRFEYIDHDFGYTQRKLPGRFSMAQDLWGYNNGATTNST
ncbi:MAG: hypothetical protein MRY83_15460, partial [Flavobacteriales bacterium]|nr:hypothetical protein [Flavobacteriales bacterium]